MTIAAFLLARIAEDEELVREANPPHAGRTFYSHFGHGADDWGVYYFNVPIERMLAECAAKRAIVEVCAPNPFDDPYETRDLTSGVLLALAAVYASHPDFDPAWQSPVSASPIPTQE